MLGAAMEEEGPRAAAAQRFLELLSFQPLGHLHLAQALLLAHVDPASSLILVFLPPPGFVLLPGQSVPLGNHPSSVQSLRCSIWGPRASDTVHQHGAHAHRAI